MKSRKAVGSIMAIAIALLGLVGSAFGSASAGPSGGSIGKGSVVGFTPTEQVAAKIKGIGSIVASCVESNDVVSDAFPVELVNARDEAFTVAQLGTTIDGGDGDVAHEFRSLPAAGSLELHSETNYDSSLRLHVLPTSGAKSPQADVVVDVLTNGTCATAQITVLSVAT